MPINTSTYFQNIRNQRILQRLLQDKNPDRGGLPLDLENIIDRNEHLEKALIFFEKHFDFLANLDVIGSESDETLIEHSEEFKRFLSLFTPYLRIESDNLYFDLQGAITAWYADAKNNTHFLTLKEVHQQDINLPLAEQFAQKQLNAQAWLTDLDIRRFLNYQALPDIPIIPFNVKEIGIELHFIREQMQRDGLRQLTTYFLIHDQDHWVTIKAEIDLDNNKINYLYEDSLSGAKFQNKNIEKVLREATKFKQDFFIAFPTINKINDINIDFRCTGEQKDGWSCGYFALKNLLAHIKPEVFENIHSTRELRDKIYQVLLGNAPFTDDEQLALTTNADLLENYIVNLSKTTHKKVTSVDLETQAAFIKNVKRYQSSPAIKAFQTAESSALTLNLDQLFADLACKTTEEKQALITALLETLKTNRHVETLGIADLSVLTPEELTYFTEQAEILGQIKNFTVPEEFQKPFKIIAARNQLLANFKVNVFETDIDLWDSAVKSYLQIKGGGAKREALYFYKNKANFEDKNPELDRFFSDNNLLVHAMGARWFKEILNYFDNHHAQYQNIAFPYPVFEISIQPLRANNLVPDENLGFNINYLSELKNYLSAQGYFSFKLLDINAAHYTDNLIDELIELLPFLNDSGLERLVITSTSHPETNLSEDALKKLLAAVNENKTTTSIVLHFMEANPLLRDAEKPTVLTEIKNQIIQATFENKKAKTQKKYHDYLMGAAQPEEEKTAQKKPKAVKTSVTAVKRKAKFNADSALAGLEQEIQIQEQKQQQEEQQVVVEEDRDDLIDEFETKNAYLNQLSLYGDNHQQDLISYANHANYENQNYFSSYASFSSQTYQQLIESLFSVNQAIGPKIAFLTRPAFEAITLNWTDFAYGLNLDNLPEGFYLQNKGNELVLCYDVTLVTTQKITPLTPYSLTVTDLSERINSFNEHLKREERSADTVISEETLTIINQLLEKDDKSENQFYYNQYILKPENQALIASLKNNQLAGFYSIFSHAGITGIALFLEKMHKLQQHMDDENFTKFTSSFVPSGEYKWEDLLSENNLSAIDELCKMDATSLNWFLTLSTEQAKFTKPTQLAPMVEAFKYFEDELKEIAPDIRLPSACPLSGVVNMKVALDRLLIIIKNSLNKQEQIDNLAGIDLSPGGAFAAKRYGGYRIVTPEMHLTGSNQEIIITKKDFINSTKPFLVNDYLVHYYRYIAQQRYQSEFALYRALAKQALIGLNSFDETIQNDLLKIIAITTTNKAGYQLNNSALLTQIIEKIKRANDEQPQLIETFLPLFHRFLGIEQITLADIALSMTLALDYINDLHDNHTVFISMLYQISKYAGKTIFTALALYQKNPAGLDRQQFITLLRELYTNKDPLNQHLLMLYSLINRENLDNNNIDELKRLMLILNKQPSVLATLVDLLKTINFEPPGKALKIVDLVRLLQSIVDANDVNKDDPIYLWNKISTELPEYNFDYISTPAVDEQAIYSLIESKLQELRTEITKYKSFLPGNLVPEDDNLKDAKSLITWIKDKNQIIQSNPLIAGFLFKILQPILEGSSQTTLKNKIERSFPDIKTQQQVSEIIKNYPTFIHHNDLITLISVNNSNLQALNALIEALQNLQNNFKTSNPLQRLLRLKTSEQYTLENFHQLILTINQLALENLPFPNRLLSLFFANPATKQLQKQMIETLTEIMHSKLPESMQIDLLNIILNLPDNEKSNSLNYTTQALTILNQLADAKIANLLLQQLKNSEHFIDDLTNINNYLTIIDHIYATRKAEDINNIKVRSLRWFANDAQNIMPDFINAFFLVKPIKKTSLLEITLALAETYNDTKEDLLNLLEALNAVDLRKLRKLQKLYENKPFPNANQLLTYLQNPGNISLEEFADNFDKNRAGRPAYDNSQIIRIIDNIQLKPQKTLLNLAHRHQLQAWFLYINGIGEKYAISVNGKQYLPLKDQTRSQLQTFIQTCLEKMKDPDISRNEMHLIHLQYFAAIREILFRTTGLMPNELQMIALLTTYQQKQNVTNKIDTGQGKSIVSLLQASLLLAKGYTVDIFSSNMALAKRDQEASQDFFNYLGFSTALIHAASKTSDYQTGGVNFSDVANIALFRSRHSIENTSPEAGKPAAILDESDFSLLDNTTNFRYAKNLELSATSGNIFEWIYAEINQFIENPIFLNPNASKFDDINNLRSFINNSPTLTMEQKKQFNKATAYITDEQLDVWLDAALSAKNLVENTHYVIVADAPTSAETKPLAKAHILSNHRISKQSKWSNGVHQFLHARLNADLIQGKKYEFPIEAEVSSVATETSKTVVDYYRHTPQGLVTLTASPGNAAEITEIRQKYGIQTIEFPTQQILRREPRPSIIADNEIAQQQKIVDRLKQLTRGNHESPILLVCQSIDEANAIYALMESNIEPGVTLQLYTGLGPESEDEIVRRAGNAKTITISTPILGRGTDIKPVNQLPLEVISTFFPIVKREGKQIEGRTGRQGMLGFTQIIANREDLTPGFIKSIVAKDDVDYLRELESRAQKLTTSGPVVIICDTLEEAERLNTKLKNTVLNTDKRASTLTLQDNTVTIMTREVAERVPLQTENSKDLFILKNSFYPLNLHKKTTKQVQIQTFVNRDTDNSYRGDTSFITRLFAKDTTASDMTQLKTARKAHYQKQKVDRQYREMIGDIRNYLFTQFINLRNKAQTLDPQALLKQWATLLNEFDKAAKTLQTETDSFDAFTAALMDKGVNAWNKFIESFDNLDQYKLENTDGMRRALTKDVEEMPITQEQYIPLRERSTHFVIGKLDEASSQLGLPNKPEITLNQFNQEIRINALKDYIFSQHPSLRKAYEKMHPAAFEAQVSVLFSVLLTAIYDANDPEGNEYPIDDKTLHDYYYALGSYVAKHGANNMLYAAYSAHESHYQKITKPTFSLHSQHYLLIFDRDLRILKQKGTFGDEDINAIKQEKFKVQDDELSEDNIQEAAEKAKVSSDDKSFITNTLQTYQNSWYFWRLSKDRKENVGKLLNFVDTQNDRATLLQAIYDARDNALATDKAVNASFTATIFGKRNRYKSRYQIALMKIRNRLLANVTDAERPSIFILELNDLQKLITECQTVFSHKLNGFEKFNFNLPENPTVADLQNAHHKVRNLLKNLNNLNINRISDPEEKLLLELLNAKARYIVNFMKPKENLPLKRTLIDELKEFIVNYISQSSDNGQNTSSSATMLSRLDTSAFALNTFEATLKSAIVKKFGLNAKQVTILSGFNGDNVRKVTLTVENDENQTLHVNFDVTFDPKSTMITCSWPTLTLTEGSAKTGAPAKKPFERDDVTLFLEDIAKAEAQEIENEQHFKTLPRSPKIK